MDPVERTPTELADYAALSAIYGALLAGTAVSARGREPIPTAELPALAAASFALSKLVVHEKVESWMRRPFVDERRRRPKGRRLRYAVGELLMCTRCTGAWSALGLVALRMHSPAAGRTVSTVLAASAGNDMLQAGVSVAVRTRDHRAEGRLRPGDRARRARCRVTAASAGSTCHASDGKIPAPATVRPQTARGTRTRDIQWVDTHNSAPSR